MTKPNITEFGDEGSGPANTDNLGELKEVFFKLRVELDPYQEMPKEFHAAIEAAEEECCRLLQTQVERAERAARIDTAKHVDKWLKSDIDHHDLQRITTRMVEGRYDYADE